MYRLIFLFSALLNAYPWLYAQNLEAKLDQYLSTTLQNAAAPGFSVAVVKQGEIVFARGYGHQVANQPQKMQAETVLPIGSLTKSLTALALMQLVEADQLALDRPIKDYLPWFRTANPQLSDRITPRMLLNNSSGLNGGLVDASLQGDTATHKLIRSLEAQYLERAPGASYEYSNTGFALAGYLVKALSGMEYAEYLEKHIFQVLDMPATSTRPADFERIGSIYGHYPSIERAIPAQREPANESGAMAPAGSLMRSSAKDLAHYMISLLDRGRFGEHQLISPAGLQEMWRAQSCFPGFSYEDGGDNESLGYGLGWMMGEIEGDSLIFHGGSTGTASSMMILDPKAKIGVVLLLNLDYTFVNRYQYQSEFQLANNVLRIARGEGLSDYGQMRIADPTLNAFSLPEEKYQRYLGTYQFAGGWDVNFVYYGVDLEIKQVGDDLLGELRRGERLLGRFQLDFINEQLAIRRYQAMPDPVRFSLREDGSVESLSLFGTQFIREDAKFKARYQPLEGPDSGWRCLIPRHYQLQKSQGDLLAMSSKGVRLRVKASPNDSHQLLQKLFPEREFIQQGVPQREKHGLQLWTQQAYYSQGNDPQQCLLLSTDWQGQKLYFVLTCPFGDLSQAAAKDLYVVMNSFVG
ncbi:MAG: serine hydrolase [Bacteroidota bacterium]